MLSLLDSVIYKLEPTTLQELGGFRRESTADERLPLPLQITVVLGTQMRTGMLEDHHIASKRQTARLEPFRRSGNAQVYPEAERPAARTAL